MVKNSKLFDGIRVKPRKGRKPPTDQRTVQEGETCHNPNCDRPATHRAPKGRHLEGQFYLFCVDHVRDYNRSYNYFSGMQQEDVAAYQKDSATGHRPTWKLGENAAKPNGRARAADGSFETEDPFGVLGAAGNVKPEHSDTLGERKILPAHRQAFETLDLEHPSDREQIKTRFKLLVKKHHPDANGGDRSTEHRLREVIQAYNTLKSAGYC